MSYGELKIDTITFTAGGVDSSISVSGLVQNPTFTGNLTTTGTISGDVVRGNTVSGATVTGGAGEFGTITGNTAGFTTVTGTTVTGTTANFVTLSGTTVTGNTGQFTNITGVNIVGTTEISGATVTGDVGRFTTITGGTHTLTSGVFASGTAANPSITFVDDLDTGLFTGAANTVSLVANGAAVLTASGTNVGVGTTSPDNKLHVFAGDSSGSSSAQAQFTIENSGNSGLQFLAGTSSVSQIRFGDSGDNGAGSIAYSHSDNSIRFGTNNGTEKVRIDSSGRVGIGTSDPDGKLHVQGTSGTYPTSIINHSAIDVEGEVLRIGRTDSAVRYHSIYGKQSATDTSNYLQFRVHDGSSGSGFTSQSTVMTLTGKGSVGIGTTSPTYELQVHDPGTGLVDTRIHLTNGDTGSGGGDGFMIIANGSTAGYAVNLLQRENGPLGFWTNNQERARIDSSGRLLVGTSTLRAVEPNGGSTGGATLTTHFEGISSLPASVGLIHNGTTAVEGSALYLARTRGTAVASSTLVALGDTLGTIAFAGGDGTDVRTKAAEIYAVVDGTPGANDMPGRLVFSTTANGASSPTERMRINNSGQVLLATSSFSGSASRGGFNISPGTSNGASQVYINRATTTATSVAFIFANAETAVGTIGFTNTATSYNTSSDYRLKENVANIADGITRLQQLKPSRFNFISNPGTTVDGFIAHEVQTIVPEAITGEKDAVDDEGNPQYQGIDQSKLVPLLTAALQEAIGRIETLEAEVAALKAS